MKRLRLIAVIFILIVLSVNVKTTAYAGDNKSQEQNLGKEIEEIVSALDLSQLEEYLKSIPIQIAGADDIKSQIVKMIKGESSVDFNSVAEYLLSIFLSGIKSNLPIFISVLALLIICSILGSAKSDRLGGGIYEIVHFACFSVVVCVITAIAYSLINDAKQSIEGTGKAVQSVFPIMLALMTVTGSTASVAVYNPAMLFVSDFVVILINKIIFPVILGMLAISVISNVCKTVKLNGLLSFSSSSIKWIIGLVATVFSLFLTVRGLNSGVYDGISLRALKYTVNSSVPLVGGILRDGLDLILASGILVKNALGGIALVIVFGVAIQPIIRIACVTLSLKLICAVVEPISDGRATGFITSVCKVITFAIAAVIMVALMYVIIIILIICSSQMLF